MSTTLDIPLSDDVSLIAEEGSSRFELELKAFPGRIGAFEDDEPDGSPIERFRTGVRLTSDELMEIGFKLVEFACRYSGRADLEEHVMAMAEKAAWA